MHCVTVPRGISAHDLLWLHETVSDAVAAVTAPPAKRPATISGKILGTTRRLHGKQNCADYPDLLKTAPTSTALVDSGSLAVMTASTPCAPSTWADMKDTPCGTAFHTLYTFNSSLMDSQKKKQKKTKKQPKTSNKKKKAMKAASKKMKSAVDSQGVVNENAIDPPQKKAVDPPTKAAYKKVKKKQPKTSNKKQNAIQAASKKMKTAVDPDGVVNENVIDPPQKKAIDPPTKAASKTVKVRAVDPSWAAHVHREHSKAYHKMQRECELAGMSAEVAKERARAAGSARKAEVQAQVVVD